MNDQDMDHLELGKLYAFRMKPGKGLFPNAHLNYETFVGRVMGLDDGFAVDLEEGDKFPSHIMPEDVDSHAEVASRISGRSCTPRR